MLFVKAELEAIGPAKLVLKQVDSQLIWHRADISGSPGTLDTPPLEFVGGGWRGIGQCHVLPVVDRERHVVGVMGMEWWVY